MPILLILLRWCDRRDATQLTNSTKQSTYAVSYFPNDARILYTYDRSPSNLYVYDFATKKATTPALLGIVPQVALQDR
ncbi:MAG TPA: hypothetical protein VFR78_15425 [Pyrinomonadaceae bacterium]|nr:hypothetical protein [Pyrinomonadaceae bacterium]